MPRALIALILASAACDRTESPEVAAAHKAQLADARATCVTLFQRQRGCTDTFIAALVDLRRELDTPHGIAQQPREVLVAAAHEEWKSDSTDEAISSQCDHLAETLPPPSIARAKGCIGFTTCGELVSCVIPLMRDQLAR